MGKFSGAGLLRGRSTTDPARVAVEEFLPVVVEEFLFEDTAPHLKSTPSLIITCFLKCGEFWSGVLPVLAMVGVGSGRWIQAAWNSGWQGLQTRTERCIRDSKIWRAGRGVKTGIGWGKA